MLTIATHRFVSAARRALGPWLGAVGVRFFDFFYGERAIAEVPPHVEPTIALETRHARSTDFTAILARVGAAEAPRIRQAIGAGEVCVVAVSEGALTGFIFASLERVDLAGVPICALPANGAYVHTAYVFAEYRGRKVLQVLGRALHLALAERGCRFTCRLIDRENAPSLVGTERGGVHLRWAPVVKFPGAAPFFVPPRPPALRRR